MTSLNQKAPLEEAEQFLKDHPETEVIDLMMPDMNGIVRGKQIPATSLKKIFTKGLAYPGSSNLMDVKGMVVDTIPDGGLDGDPDQLAFPVSGTLSPVPWAPRPTAQMLMSLYGAKGAPHHTDPRHVLARALEPLKSMGLTPVIALELEFYLLDASSFPPVPATPSSTLPLQTGPQVYNLDPLYDFHDFIGSLEDICKAQSIPATSTVCEYGPGQFEVNLAHGPDPLLACDQAILLKRAVKGAARTRGLVASFMAKPLTGEVGNGMHVHLSLLDQEGNNIFAGSSADNPYSDEFKHAIGGLCATMEESFALFAPNSNSYRRFQPGVYVPLTPNWGINHRGVSLRVPIAEPEDIRFEHRVAGADANPYLVVSALLAGLHHGLSNKVSPPPMVEERTVLEEVITLPTRWEQALNAFEASEHLPYYLGKDYVRLFTACRRCEAERLHGEVSDRDYDWYLRTV